MTVELSPHSYPAYSLNTLILATLYFAGNEFSGIIVCWTIRRLGLGKVLSVVIYLLLIGLVVSVAGYLLTERSNEDAQNSPEFEKALAIWRACIVTGCDTPRELKRVVNDLRYRAMTKRDTGPTVTRGERITQWLRNIVTGRKMKKRTRTAWMRQRWCRKQCWRCSSHY